MEHLDPSKKTVFEAVDITFHGRNLRPTESFSSAMSKASNKGSKVIRVYGTPRFVLDHKTGFIYLGHQFSKEITEKIMNGELVFSKGVPIVVDSETQCRIQDKQKRRLKNSTRVYHKH